MDSRYFWGKSSTGATYEVTYTPESSLVSRGGESLRQDTCDQDGRVEATYYISSNQRYYISSNQLNYFSSGGMVWYGMVLGVWNQATL